MTPPKTNTPPGKSKKKKAPEKMNAQVMLSSLVFQIFLLVAHADGEIDADELNRYHRFMKHPDYFSSKYTRYALKQALGLHQDLVKSYSSGRLKRDMEKVKLAMEKLQKGISQEDMVIFKKDLYKFGEEIAKASGGFFNKVSDEERKVLDELKSTLAT